MVDETIEERYAALVGALLRYDDFVGSPPRGSGAALEVARHPSGVMSHAGAHRTLTPFALSKPKRGGIVGCLLVLLAAFAPRLVVIFAWIARPAYFNAVFSTFIFPLLGLIFLPFTTLMVLLVGAPPLGVTGVDWLWVGLAVLLDLSHYGNTWSQRATVSARMR